MQVRMLKQVIDFNKASFESAFNVMVTLQEQMERMLKIYIDQTAGLPEEGKKALNEWMDVYKKGCDDFKTSIDEGFKKLDVALTQKK